MSHRLVREGHLQADASQLAAAQALELLQRALVAAAPSTAAAPPATTAAAASSPPSAAAKARGNGSHSGGVQGCYLFGHIGSGKTMLMDMMLETLPPGLAARRFHLHDLLAHAHARAHALREALPRVVAKTRLGLPVYRCACVGQDVWVRSLPLCQGVSLSPLHRPPLIPSRP